MGILKRSGIAPPQVILMSFIALIGVGTLLLMLPCAARAPGGAGFFDALFTATSATCVTGLVVRDTFTFWTPFGQAVILALIQVGGMGVVTMAVTIAIFTGRSIGLKSRLFMKEAISAPQVGGIIRMTGSIVRATLCIEGAGAALLAIRFCPRFGPEGIWYAVFHSVSAFCNAGFDLMGRDGEYSSLVGYAADPLVNVTIMSLIVVGGIGFYTWADIRAHGRDMHAYSLRTKLILSVTAALIFFPALMFFFTEFAGLPAGQRVLESLFQSVTARTAGFNTADLTAMSGGARLVLIALMLVGGAPGSTAGGFKVTSLAAVIFNIRAVFRGSGSVRCFGRRLPQSAISRACAICALYIVVFAAAGLAISAIDGVSIGRTLFEAASAIGTVGLTLGLTPELGIPSRMILVFLMYFGRVGGLTMMYAVTARRIQAPAEMPEEDISIG